MFVFNPWILLAPVFALITLWFAKRRASVRWVRGSVIFLCLAFSAWLWTPAHFAAVGCTGDMATGLACPDGTLLTKFALLHQVLMLMGQIYFFLVLPPVFLWIYWSERRARA